MHRLSLAPLLIVFAACATSSESASSDTLTTNVGQYSMAPMGIQRPRVGVPPFSVSGQDAKAEMNDTAADQLSTLLVRSQRFVVIERAQLDQLLAEQDLEGIVQDGELAAAGQVRGVDYLMIGKVSNLRTKVERKKSGFGLGKIGGVIGVGAADWEKEDVSVTTDCGVDLRLVSATTGEIAVANFSEFKRTDNAAAMGLEILGFDADAEAEIEITEDDYGKIMRLALDDAVRKMLPELDQFLVRTATTTP